MLLAARVLDVPESPKQREGVALPKSALGALRKWGRERWDSPEFTVLCVQTSRLPNVKPCGRVALDGTDKTRKERHTAAAKAKRRKEGQARGGHG